MSVFLGIDFGCSTCRTVLLRDGKPELVRNRFDERGLPPVPPVLSLPAIDTEQADFQFPVVFRSLKQELGSLEQVDTVGGSHSIADKIAEVLKQIREDVLGAISGPVDGTVLAIPGIYTDSPRAALRDAAHSAGFSAVRLVDEGLAAILGATRPLERGTTLVYALGSGVFSATVVSFENGRPRVLSAEGDRFLGGSDFDIALASLILKRLGLGVDFVNPRESAKSLKQLAALVKAGLSRREEVLFDVNLMELFGKGGTASVSVKRSELEAAIAKPVDLTFELSRKALEAAGTSPGELKLIVMLGESTSIPLIEGRLAAEFGAPRVRAGSADVARGAAIFGGQLGEANWKRRDPESPEPPPPPPEIVPEPEVRVADQGTWIADFAPDLLRAEISWRKGDVLGAIRIFERKAHGFLGTLYHSEGQRFLRNGNYASAIEMLSRAVQVAHDRDDLDRYNRDFHQSLRAQAIQFEKAGYLEEAHRMVRKALEVRPGCESCTQFADRLRRQIRANSAGRSGKKRR